MRQIAILMAVFLVGCASIFGKSTETITFETTPSGEAILVDGQNYMTPAQVTLGTDRDHSVIWPDGTQSAVTRSFNPWFIGNIFWGLAGIVGAGIDVITGKINSDLTPNQLSWRSGEGVINPTARKASQKDKPTARYSRE